MPIPDFQTLMLPLLCFVATREACTVREAIDAMEREFQLTEDERREMLPSGRQTTFANRVGWSKTYLTKARLLESPRRAVVRVTERGRQVLSSPPGRITIKYLARFKEFVDFRALDLMDGPTEEEAAGVQAEGLPPAKGIVPSVTPEEELEAAFQKLRTALADDLLNAILAASPAFFEQLVIDLLVKMGYGGTRKDAGEAIGRSHDGGIDGIIKEDRLGLDIIYVQAKRWSPDRTVGRPDVQQFVGALQGQRARKGVFITTSRIAPTAHEYVKLIDSKIALIDGQKLAQLMIDYGLGVTTVNTYEIKRMDSDYFEP